MNNEFMKIERFTLAKSELDSSISKLDKKLDNQ